MKKIAFVLLQLVVGSAEQDKGLKTNKFNVVGKLTFRFWVEKIVLAFSSSMASSRPSWDAWVHNQDCLLQLRFLWIFCRFDQNQLVLMEVIFFKTKVIHPNYSKHWPYTVEYTIDCVCSKMLNHGLFLSLFKLIPCPIHWIVYVLDYLNSVFEFQSSFSTGGWGRLPKDDEYAALFDMNRWLAVKCCPCTLSAKDRGATKNPAVDLELILMHHFSRILPRC